MGYAALLFCPDEKTARTVTQVLSDLEFAVEASTEPFAAVKKLMGQHFDAVMVDCDNEQNATLIFKSARNSTSNQASLAVAIVEDQAGVAKAFRIGANLVLTKPINIEQTKGTLRVARGLLRKSDPAKPAGTAAGAAANAASKTTTATAGAAASSPLAPEPATPSLGSPTPMWPKAAAGSPKAPAHDDDLLGIDDEPVRVAGSQNKGTNPTPGFDSKPASAAATIPTSGAASAPAPARERVESELFEKPLGSTAAVGAPEKPVEAVKSDEPAIVGSAPSFTFGGTATEQESGGGMKKVVIGIAAALVVVAGLYFGWAHFHGNEDQPGATDTSSTSTAAPVSTPAPTSSKPSKPQTAASKPSATSVSAEPSSSAPAETKGHKNDSSKQEDVTKDSSDDGDAGEAKPEEAPLIVKGGKASHAKNGGADAAPPSIAGMATPNAGAPPMDLIPTTTPTLRPTLQTLNISQGVSQGLLIKKVPPAYPPTALRMHIEGTVELMATISKTGEITHIKIVSGDSQLTKAAAEAVKQWKYKPYLLNGEPVEIQTQVTVNFKLPR